MGYTRIPPCVGDATGMISLVPALVIEKNGEERKRKKGKREREKKKKRKEKKKKEEKRREKRRGDREAGSKKLLCPGLREDGSSG